jgi:hypothetical protein
MGAVPKLEKSTRPRISAMTKPTTSEIAMAAIRIIGLLWTQADDEGDDDDAEQEIDRLGERVARSGTAREVGEPDLDEAEPMTGSRCP